MAIRSNAGTGVIVSLVVFVLATVFLLVLSIVFYASGREQAEEVAKLNNSFEEYVKKEERGKDEVKNLLSKAGGDSLVSYLNA